MKIKIYVPYDPITGEIDWTEIKSEKPTIFNTHGAGWCWHEKEIDLPNVIEVPEIFMVYTDDWSELYLDRKDFGGRHSWRWSDILVSLNIPFRSFGLSVDWDKDLGGKWPEILPDSLVPESLSKQSQKLTLTTLGVKNKQGETNED